MKNNIIQTSCSELLVATDIYEVEDAYNKFSKMFKELGWESSPPLSIDTLQRLKDNSRDEDNFEDEKEIDESYEVMVYDKQGNRAWLQYGDNGYITTGFRFDSQCNHLDSLCFSIFQQAIKKLKGKLIACDGGSKEAYEVWERETGSG